MLSGDFEPSKSWWSRRITFRPMKVAPGPFLAECKAGEQLQLTLGELQLCGRSGQHRGLSPVSLPSLIQAPLNYQLRWLSWLGEMPVSFDW